MSHLDPVILFFVLGVIAGVARADLKLPAAIYEFVSTLLLLAIGLKGGVELARDTGGLPAVEFVAILVLGRAASAGIPHGGHDWTHGALLHVGNSGGPLRKFGEDFHAEQSQGCAAFMGKLTKIAAGSAYTHAGSFPLEVSFVAALGERQRLSAALLRNIVRSVTVRGILELLLRKKSYSLIDAICM